LDQGRGADLFIRRLLTLVATVVAAMALSASPPMAIVGGDDAEPGEYPAVAEVTFGAFSCTGTLIAPNYVLSAGHCGSITGAAVGRRREHRSAARARTPARASTCPFSA
jgi:secreted trypsin-like serine protease